MPPIRVSFSGDDDEFVKFFNADEFEFIKPNIDDICVVYHIPEHAFNVTPNREPALCYLHVWPHTTKIQDIKGSNHRHIQSYAYKELGQLDNVPLAKVQTDNKERLIDACRQTLKDYLMALKLVQLCKQFKKKMYPPQEPENLVGKLLGGGVDLSDVPGDVDTHWKHLLPILSAPNLQQLRHLSLIGIQLNHVDQSDLANIFLNLCHLESLTLFGPATVVAINKVGTVCAKSSLPASRMVDNLIPQVEEHIKTNV